MVVMRSRGMLKQRMTQMNSIDLTEPGEIKKTVILKGPWAGTVYTPPFPFHGPLVVLGGIAAFVLFLVGIHLIWSDRRR